MATTVKSISAYIDQAYIWCIKARLHFPANDSVWFTRRDWATLKPKITAKILNRTYEFEPVKQIEKKTGELCCLWNATDAIVLKAISLWLYDSCYKVLSKNCTHIKNNGSLPGAQQKVSQNCSENTFYFKTDVQSFGLTPLIWTKTTSHRDTGLMPNTSPFE